jgi:hypothetical protein
VASTGDRFGINLISAVTAKGKLRFAAYEGSLNGPVFIDFCRRLLHETPGPVFLVLDGHPHDRIGRAGVTSPEDLFRVSKTQGTAVLPAVSPGRVRP